MARRNLIDRIVGYFNPGSGLRRQAARQMLHRAYEGASRADGWVPQRAGASANADHARDGRELRVRSRALVQNVPYVAQGLRSLVANVVGVGITPTWADALSADKLNSAWAKWVKECDADGRTNYYGMQAAAYRAMQQDGEVIIRLRPRLKSDGLTVPLQLQLLEIDFLDSDKTLELATGGRIVNGIEYDPLGRASAYWLFDQHPGDAVRFSRASLVSRRIDAQYIIHLFTPDRAGQGRGFPRIAPVIARVRDLQLYEDAELNRKNLEARISVLGSGSIELLANQDMPAPEGNGAAGALPRTGETLGALASGGIMSMPIGTNFTVVQPQAMPGYVEYVKHQLHLIAAGFGVTYEMMTGDVTEVNFSSARVRMLDFRREAEVEQWSLLAPNLCDRVCRAFEDAAVLADIVHRATYLFYHSTPKWSYVDPSKDVNADLAEVSGGLSSISEKLRQRGYNPDDVFKELASDIEKLRTLGVLDVLSGWRTDAAVATGNTATADDETKPSRKKAKA
ncbi:phage portal protein [Variovorax sp. J22G73]|uniref:phage portal protein n=1 Tax=unclassified Variovorax TaxID=663243 RepID=UPI0025759231|nr:MULTISPECIES: phage portal protein [unclassified Variovorax]MDM0003898.1 phage portal protein [Variovorax sp. J22R203]MDM0096436.1 phage portal protein [Variovorax sp. J22G73]